MTMFYAGTPITCIWCDKSRYMTSHVVLVVKGRALPPDMLYE
ncbi:hypothetical protein AB0Y92_11710 [Escherichia coli]